jgi:3-deoxy-D-manno-octulosonic acid kinase
VYCRRYLRGGLPRYIVRDLYLMRPERPVRELIVTEAARAAGCPVPTVLACAVEEAGLFYRGWLVTEAIEQTRPLIDVFLEADSAGRRALLGDAGRAIRQLHAAGIYHVDLNGNNLLVREGGSLVIIDFDKGWIGQPCVARRMQRGLDRFWRSLRKLSHAADRPLADEERRWLDSGHDG